MYLTVSRAAEFTLKAEGGRLVRVTALAVPGQTKGFAVDGARYRRRQVRRRNRAHDGGCRHYGSPGTDCRGRGQTGRPQHDGRSNRVISPDAIRPSEPLIRNAAAVQPSSWRAGDSAVDRHSAR